MSLELIDGTGLWSVTTAPAPPIPPEPPAPDTASHSPHDWRTANLKTRRLILRGLLPEEFEQSDLDELDEIITIFDDLNDFPS